jgi:hypothetical protein
MLLTRSSHPLRQVRIMKEQDLVAAVRETAGTDTVEHTEQAVRATLAVLAARRWGTG